MDTSLDGKIAVVTGSTSGIGATIARALAADGAAVIISGRRHERGAEVVAQITAHGGRALFEPADLSHPEDCARLCRRAADAWGGLDILVNNAGDFTRRDFEATDADFWDGVFDLNVRAAFLCSQAAVPHMRQRGGGSIVNIGSGNAFARGGGRLFAYGCSKAALYGLSMKLAGELARDRIRVNWITVGWILTEKEFEVQAGEGLDREQLAANEARLPMGQYNTEEDIALGCLYLASDAAARVTGSDLNISAGLSIRI